MQQTQKRSTVNHIHISKYQIFEIFVKFYYRNEMKRIAGDQTLKEICEQLFGIEEERDLYDEIK